MEDNKDYRRKATYTEVKQLTAMCLRYMTDIGRE